MSKFTSMTTRAPGLTAAMRRALEDRERQAMTPPTLRAIKCSERMPTREDANCDGFVLWGGPLTRTRSPQQFDYQPWWATHFYPLNRSAIATDAEEDICN